MIMHADLEQMFIDNPKNQSRAVSRRLLDPTG
jgi:hypothetical protein